MFICDISMLNRLGKASLDEMLQIIDFSWREMVVLMVLKKKPGRLQGDMESFKADREKLGRALSAASLDGAYATLASTRKQQADDREIGRAHV